MTNLLAEVLTALRMCVSSLDNADNSDGVCMCGDDMDNHASPMDCGHTPTDAGLHHANQAKEAARTVIKKLENEE